MNEPTDEPWLPMEDPEPPLDALIECVERELAYRRHVYPRRVARRVMTQQLAERQIRLMNAVLKNLEAQRRRQ